MATTPGPKRTTAERRGDARRTLSDRARPVGRAAVLHPVRKSTAPPGRTPEARLSEAMGLAAAIGLDVVHAERLSLARPNPSHYFGRGSVDRVAEIVSRSEIDLVCVDAPLSPTQQRNLERAWRCKALDRTGLILEIFGARARTREGALQVELAHLTWQRSRLVRSWTHLERQRGGLGFVGGPGETQIESDRRQIDDRIARIRRALETVARTRTLHRRARRRVPHPVVALVGYTNAGKSTLFNRLTQADARAEDMLFATLDPAMRGTILPSGRRAIMSDTVGFISGLPTTLVAAFRATLEEVVEADAIVHVRDAAHPDSEAQHADVLHVLAELGIEQGRGAELIEAHNKIDLLDDRQRDQTLNRAVRQGNVVPVSAATGAGIDALRARLDEVLGRGRRIVEIDVDAGDGARLAWLYRHGEVVERRDDAGGARLRVGLDLADLARFRRLGGQP